jgi:hypothetical protein
MPVGCAGYWLADVVAGSGPSILCHPGAGGTIAWADFDRRLAVAICHNRMFPGAAADAHPFIPLALAIRELVAENH